MTQIRVLFAISVMSAGMSALGDPPREGPKGTGPLKRMGHVLIEEDVWFRFHDEPPLHMERAREGFLKKEFGRTSQELHKTGGYLHAAASHADEEVKGMLRDSAEELDLLSASVKEGTVESVEELERAFARAEHALAIHNQHMSRRAMEQANTFRSGHYLKAAIQHAENSACWAGHELGEDSQKILNTGKALAGKMIETPGFVIQESSKGILAVGSELQLFGKWLEPKKAGSPRIRN